MTPEQFESIVVDLVHPDLDGVRFGDVLARLARSICAHTEVERVTLHAGWADDAPAKTDATITVDSTADGAPRAATWGSIELPDEVTVVLGDLRPTWSTILPARDGQTGGLLVVRTLLPRLLAYFELDFGGEIYEGEAHEAWAGRLTHLTRIATQGRDDRDSMLAQRDVQDTSAALLELVPEKSAEDMRRVCELWREVAEADWTSLCSSTR